MGMLGSSLREAREAKQLPLREVEWATRIRSQYLAALEDEDFNRLPAPAYARGYIRAYAEYLGIDPGPLLVEYGSRQGAAEIISTRPPVRRRRAPIAITPGLIAGGVMLLLVALFIFYIGSAIQRFEASKNAAE